MECSQHCLKRHSDYHEVDVAGLKRNLLSQDVKFWHCWKGHQTTPMFFWRSLRQKKPLNTPVSSALQYFPWEILVFRHGLGSSWCFRQGLLQRALEGLMTRRLALFLPVSFCWIISTLGTNKIHVNFRLSEQSCKPFGVLLDKKVKLARDQ